MCIDYPMQFGVCSAPAIFQAEMNHILRPLLDECVVVYLDGILMYSKNMKEHVEHLRKGRPIQFDTWLDDLQLYLLSDSSDSVSLFDHTSGAAPTPPATADSATRSQWLTRDAAACLAIRNHLPLTECAHFGQHMTTQALYDAVVARYSLPATADLDRLLLPYVFPELSAFATVEDLVSHLCTSDARYCAAVPAEDHILALDPTVLTVDLLEQHLLADETSVVAVGATRGTPRTPFFEGCSPSPLAPSYASAAAIDVLGAEDAGAASARGKLHSSKGKGGRGGGGGSGGGGGGSIGAVGVAVVAAAGVVAVGLELLSLERGASGGRVSCPYVICTGDRAGQTCGKPHTQHRCFSRLDDTWRAEFGDEAERPRWAELLRSGVAIFDLDYDAKLAAMYALSVSAEGDCYLCVPPDPGIQVVVLGARDSALLGTVPAAALHTFTLDSGPSHCFFRDSTTLTPLLAPVPVRLADPSRGPVLARSSTVLPCPAVPSGSLSGFHLPSFSTNLVSTAAFHDAMVTTTTPGGQRVLICTCTRKGRHLATLTPRSGLSLYTLAIDPPLVAASPQVSALGPVAPPCSCRLLSHQTLLWHHRLGHPSLPRLYGMHSRLRFSGLRRSLPPLPPSPTPPCLPCVEGRQGAAPHSSFPPTTAPLQTLNMDVWGLARVNGQGRERYFQLVVDDYTRYTTVFPFRNKGQVLDVLITWIRAVHLQLRERFRQDLPVLRLHSDRGGEFSSDLLREFYRGEGVLQSFTLLDSLQQNGIAERRIGLVMEVARTSMIHAAAPHFLWPFAVRYAAYQLNLWPRASFRETSPTLCWTGKVGDASVFRFYHPTSRRVLPSKDVTFDESVPFYHLFPYRSTPPPPLVLFLAPAIDSGAFRGAASGGAEPGGAESEGAMFWGVEPEGVEPGGAESGGAEPRGTASSRGPAGASPRLSPRPEPLSPQLREWFTQRTRLRSGAAGAGDSAAGDTRAGGAGVTAGAGGTGGAGVTAGAGGTGGAGVTAGAGDTGGAGVTAGAGGTGGAAAAGPGGARTRGTGAAGTGSVGGAGAGDPTEPRAAGAGGTGAGGTGTGGARAGRAGAGDTGAGGIGAGGAGAVDPRAGGAGAGVLGVPSSTGLTPPLLCPPPDVSQPPLQPISPLPAPSPYTEQTGGLIARREHASHPASPVRTGGRVPRSRPPPVPGTYAMALRPSSVPLRVPLPPPLDSSFPDVLDPESDRARVVTDPSFECTTASALVAELVDFAAACCLDYATALVAKSESASPPSIGGECALGTDVLEDRQEDFECLAAAVPRFASMLLAPEGDPDAPDIPTPRSYAEAITGPYSSQWQAAMDAEMASWKSTGTYVDAVPLSRANIVDGMGIFRVKRPTGSLPAFKARYVARGYSQRHGVDYFHTFSPTLKMTTLWYSFLAGQPARGDLAAPPTWLHWVVSYRYPVEPPAASVRSPSGASRVARYTEDYTCGSGVYCPVAVSTHRHIATPLYVLVYVEDLVFGTADTEALTLVKSELQKRHTCTDIVELRSYLGLQITRDRARRTITLTQSNMVHQVLQRFGFQFSSPQPTPLSTGHSLSALPLHESVEPSSPQPTPLSTGHSLSAPPSDEFVEPSGLYP
ncbi:unnamed protein product [Closterium sp. NIES-53]